MKNLKINIDGLSHAEVIAAVYNNSIPLRMGFFTYMHNTGEMSIVDAEQYVEQATKEYLAYVNGKYMNMSIRGETLYCEDTSMLVDYWNSDEDKRTKECFSELNCPEPIEKVIEELKAKK